MQDLRSEKKEPEKVVESPDEIQETSEEKEKQMDEYEEIVNDEYCPITMEDDISEIIGDVPEDEDEEVAEGETIRAISEEEYDEGAFGFERVDLMYFVDDGILCDSDMVTIDNKDEWLGNVNLKIRSDEITVNWIRNFDLSYDIRLEVIGDAYSGSR